MAVINEHGYLVRVIPTNKNNRCKPVMRDWWLVKNHQIELQIKLPRAYLGKRVKLKLIVEEVKNGERN